MPVKSAQHEIRKRGHMETAGLLIGMATASFIDIKKKKIPLFLMIGLMVFAFVMHFVYERLSIYEMIFGAAMGLVLISIAVLTKERIGIGDGVIFVVVGLFTGFFGSVIILWYSSICAAILGFIICVIRRFDHEKLKDVTLPFAPCVLIGIIIYILRNGGGF